LEELLDEIMESGTNIMRKGDENRVNVSEE
jgi:hypothetical protein